MVNYGPAIVLATLKNIDFIAAAGSVESAGPVLSLKQKICARLKINSLRVAISVSPNLRPRISLSDEGVVAGHGAVIIQAQRLAGQRIEFLRQLALGGIAGGYVKLAVRSKSQTTAGVQVRRRNVFDDHFAISETVRRFAITHHSNILIAAFVVGIGEI